MSAASWVFDIIAGVVAVAGLCYGMYQRGFRKGVKYTDGKEKPQ
jgi:hypothetical protein